MVAWNLKRKYTYGYNIGFKTALKVWRYILLCAIFYLISFTNVLWNYVQICNIICDFAVCFLPGLDYPGVTLPLILIV